MAKAKKKAKKVKAKQKAKKSSVKKKKTKKKPVKKAAKKKLPKKKAKPAKKIKTKKKKPSPKAKKKAKAATKKTKTKPKAPTKAKATTQPKPLKTKKASPPEKPKAPPPKPKPPTPVLKVILCGPHSVYWIPNDTDIHPTVFDQGLKPEEQDLAKVFKAPMRRKEFLRARWLVRRVSKSREPLLKDGDGLPNWPKDLIGSISHKNGHVIFCKATTETHYGLGIDMEQLGKVKEGFESKICNEAESRIVDRVEALARMARQEVLALIFSFKEAIFKTHYPMGKTFFSFHDAEIIEIAYERREIKAKMKVTTSSRSKVGHEILGFYNWIDYEDERYIISVAEERKPLIIDAEVKKSIQEEIAKPAEAETTA